MKHPPFIPGKGLKPSITPARSALKNWNCLDHEDFMRGLDLYCNHYFWEAHEVWESLWHLSSEPYKSLIQAAIKLTASRLKYMMGETEASATLLQNARQLFKKALDDSQAAAEVAALMQTMDSEPGDQPKH